MQNLFAGIVKPCWMRLRLLHKIPDYGISRFTTLWRLPPGSDYRKEDDRMTRALSEWQRQRRNARQSKRFLALERMTERVEPPRPTLAWMGEKPLQVLRREAAIRKKYRRPKAAV
jgi:hypothetical protein